MLRSKPTLIRAKSWSFTIYASAVLNFVLIKSFSSSIECTHCPPLNTYKRTKSSITILMKASTRHQKSRTIAHETQNATSLISSRGPYFYYPNEQFCQRKTVTRHPAGNSSTGRAGWRGKTKKSGKNKRNGPETKYCVIIGRRDFLEETKLFLHGGIKKFALSERVAGRVKWWLFDVFVMHRKSGYL